MLTTFLKDIFKYLINFITILSLNITRIKLNDIFAILKGPEGSGVLHVCLFYHHDGYHSITLYWISINQVLYQYFSTQSELLCIEKERLNIEKRRLKIEEDRYALEEERLHELKKISKVLHDIKNARQGISQTQTQDSECSMSQQDYSYLYASL